MATVQRLLGTRTAFTITLASLANAAARVSDQIDLTDGSGRAPIAVLVDLTIKTGGSAPTAGTTFQVYWARGEDAGSGFIDGGLAATDTGYNSSSSPLTAAQLRDQLQLVGVIPVLAIANQAYKVSFLINDPGPRGSLYIFNDSGQTISATGGDHSANYTTIKQDVS